MLIVPESGRAHLLKEVEFGFGWFDTRVVLFEKILLGLVEGRPISFVVVRSQAIKG